MPATPLKNALYRLALPVLAPSPRGEMTLSQQGKPLVNPKGYLRLQTKHHVLGSSLLLRQGNAVATA